MQGAFCVSRSGLGCVHVPGSVGGGVRGMHGAFCVSHTGLGCVRVLVIFVCRQAYARATLVRLACALGGL